MDPFNGSRPKMNHVGNFLEEKERFAFIHFNLFTNPPLPIAEGQLKETLEIINRGLGTADRAMVS